MFKSSWIHSVFDRTRKWLIVKLQVLTYLLMRPDNDREHALRLGEVRKFIYNDLPQILGYSDLAVIEGGKFNYFRLPSGDLPRYDFVCPQLALYVYVPNVTSAVWAEARLRGVTRDLWEYAQQDIAAMTEEMKNIEFQGEFPIPPKLVMIPWNESINKLSLAQHFRRALLSTKKDR